MDEENPVADPYDEFFKPRPLWELLKKRHGDKPDPWSEPMRVPMQYEQD